MALQGTYIKAAEQSLSSFNSNEKLHPRIVNKTLIQFQKQSSLPDTIGVSSPISSQRSLIHGKMLMVPPTASIGNINSDSRTTDRDTFHAQNINFDLQLKSKKNNVLIGAASTSFSLPVVWSGPSSTLIGFQNARQKLESQNQKRKFTLKQPQFKFQNSVLNTKTFYKPSIEQINMPLRGRPVTIGDRTRDMQQRNNLYRLNNECQENSRVPLNTYFNNGCKQNLSHDNVNPNYQTSSNYLCLQNRQPISTKIYTFKNNSKGNLVNTNDFLCFMKQNQTEYQNQFITSEGHKQVRSHERSVENIIRFLDIGKIDYDQINRVNTTKGVTVINMNKSIDIPVNENIKKNKNDFYRFLLAQNIHKESEIKLNNDILIPRSILKKCGVKPKRRNSHQNLTDEQLIQLIDNQSLDYETVYGLPLKRNNPLLSPKFNQLMQFQNSQQEIKRQLEDLQRIVEGVGTSITPNKLLKMHNTDQMQVGFSNQEDNKTIEGSSQSKQELLISNIDLIDVDCTQPTEIIENQAAQQNENNNQIQNQEIKQKTFHLVPEITSLQQQQPIDKKYRRHIVRQTANGGFFETSVEVIEHEVLQEINPISNDQKIQGFSGGYLQNSKERIGLDLQKQKLKEDRIFGYRNFNDFKSSYFQRDLVVLDDMKKANQVKLARQKYSKRLTTHSSNVETQQA